MRNFAFFLFGVLILIIFRSWFMPGLLSAFDLVYYSPLMIKDASLVPYAWGWHHGFDGFARFISPYSWISPLVNIPKVLLGSIGFNWGFIERFVYLYPALFFSLISSSLLFKKFFPANKFYLLSVIVFTLNSYALLLFSGEVFLSIAYSMSPIIILLFINILEVQNLNKKPYVLSILLGLALAFQLMADPRITYVILFILFSYFLFYLATNINKFSFKAARKLLVFLIPGVILVLLHAFWIIPSVLYGGNPIEKLGVAYSTTDAVNYLSFARFENTISLLHPNWPENIFGKVYFMKPEFIFLPILAFASLLFVKKLKDQSIKKYVIFFASLGLLGSFLAKGSNEPFGVVYLWLFDHFPGFIMFRDPAKWYLLVAVSYSILIPFTISKIHEWLKLRKANIQNVFLILVTFYLIFLIRPAITGELGGTFKITNVPNDYQRLEKFLYSKKNFFRTLWFPTNQRFGYYSDLHPKMSAYSLFNNYDSEKILSKIAQEDTEERLREASMKYVIIPEDSEGEIFLTDRKYDDKKYRKAKDTLEKVSWLKEVKSFGKIVVFEVAEPKDHFWSTSTNLDISYQFVNPTQYRVQIKDARKGNLLIFSEMYDSKWIAKGNGKLVASSSYNKLYNSFVLSKDGNYTLDVYYLPQDWVNIGLMISVFSLFGILIVLLYFYKRK